jgi:hypothetical protein
MDAPSVWFMVLLSKLNRLEEDMGWVVKMDVKFRDGLIGEANG